jgi:signal transduction histidine kinase
VIARRLSWVLLAAGGLAVLAVPVIAELSAHFVARSLIPVPYMLIYYLTGAFVFLRRPDHPCGRRMLAWGALLALAYAFGAGYSAYLLTVGTPRWGWCALLVLQAANWLVNGAVPFALFAAFPDGRYDQAYQRRAVLALMVALPALLALQLLGSPRLTATQFVWQDSVTAPNPYALKVFAPLGAFASGAIQAGILILLFGVVVLVLRFRRSDSDRRRQIAWPLYALGLTVACFGVLGFLQQAVSALPDWEQFAAYYLVVTLVPAGLLIGLLRHRLFDIELVVRRSMVYGALWLLIAIAYVAVAAAFGVVIGRRVPLELAVVLTILATAVATPVRRRLERLADRLVFGRRLSGYELIIQLGARLRSLPAPEDVARTVATSVQSGLAARWVRVVLDRPQPRPIAAVGIGPDEAVEAALSVPLLHGQDVVGTLECGPKVEGRYSGSDERLLETLGRQAALAINNSQLSTELADRLAELEASRARLVQAEESGRRRLERDIHDGVQQELVAVLARMGLARNQLRRDKDLAEATMGEAQADARRALETLQELVRGIHPAVLTDRGLLEAVEERATRLPITAHVLAKGLVRGTRFSPDVEGGAYFFVSEALTNVLKHARASQAWIELRSASDGLTIEVRDNGCGFCVDSVPSSGLRGLQDRIEALGGQVGVASAPVSGTTLRAFLPTPEHLDA